VVACHWSRTPPPGRGGTPGTGLFLFARCDSL